MGEDPIFKEGKPNNTEVASVDAWKYSDFLCKSYILNKLDNTLYVHSPIKIARELWESLDKKYKIDDAYTKKFVVGRFLNFGMVDSKIVIRLRIKDDILDLDKNGGVQTTNSEANIIEHLQTGKQVVFNFS